MGMKALKRKDLAGQKFGFITVLSFSRVDKRNNLYDVYWNCIDDFGFKKEIKSKHLLSGQIKSCGGLIHDRKREKHPRWAGCGEVSAAYFYQIKWGAEIRGLSFDITIEEIWQLFLDQNKKCKLSGQDLIFPTCDRKRDGTASLDRKDSSLGYAKDNIQWIHKEVNRMKGQMSDPDFIKMCKDIANNNP